MSVGTVRDVMTTALALVGPESSVGEVARLMREQDIGTVLVADDLGTTGLVTDRDLAVRILAEGLGPDTPVRSAMTSQPVCLHPDDPVEAASETMRVNAIRRIPVVQDGRVVGVVSLGDLARVHAPRSVLGEISAAEPNH
ncbi:CBS domain-containing protein [Catenulispora sp. MAP5-51]|uniref:CBS domain-containing protein n=1 Tax=Catenulispora sp. MAP5-51 TaxID=3156298 RepID=UPI003515DD36